MHKFKLVKKPRGTRRHLVCACGLTKRELLKKEAGIMHGIQMGIWTAERAEMISARINKCNN